MKGIPAPLREIITTKEKQKEARREWKKKAKPFFHRALGQFLEDLREDYGIHAFVVGKIGWHLEDAIVEGKMWWGTARICSELHGSLRTIRMKCEVSMPCVPIKNLRWFESNPIGDKWSIRVDDRLWLWSYGLGDAAESLTLHCYDCESEDCLGEFEVGEEAGKRTELRTLCVKCKEEYMP